MSFHKAIKHNKEYRKSYFGAKAVDASCRCHGSCPSCKRQRLRKKLKQMPLVEDEGDFDELGNIFTKGDE